MGRYQTLALALEQRQREVDFEPRQDLAHRRLRYVHPLGGSRDAACLHELDIGFELSMGDPHAGLRHWLRAHYNQRACFVVEKKFAGLDRQRNSEGRVRLTSGQ